MNQYKELKDRQQAAFNEYAKDHLFFAFSEKQFAEGMKKFGLKPTDENKIGSMGAGGFYLKEEKQALISLFREQREELEAAIEADQTGDGFIYDMFLYELQNHEYCITLDITDALNAVGLTAEQINASPALMNGLKRAVNEASKGAFD